MISWPVAFSIVGTAVAICVAAVKIFPCKMAPVCRDLFTNCDKKINGAMETAWKEVDSSKADRDGIKENIREVEKTAVGLETEVAGIHNEIKEIKADIRTILERINSLNVAVAKRNGDRNFRQHETDR